MKHSHSTHMAHAAKHAKMAAHHAEKAQHHAEKAKDMGIGKSSGKSHGGGTGVKTVLGKK